MPTPAQEHLTQELIRQMPDLRLQFGLHRLGVVGEAAEGAPVELLAHIPGPDLHPAVLRNLKDYIESAAGVPVHIRLDDNLGPGAGDLLAQVRWV